MKEREWLTSTAPRAMVMFARNKLTLRKLRLFLCGCYRLSNRFLSLPLAREALEQAELRADGEATRLAVWEAVERIAVDWDGPNYEFTRGAIEMGLLHDDPYIAADYALPWVDAHDPGSRNQRCADLLRCITGDMFCYRPPRRPIDPEYGLLGHWIAKAAREVANRLVANLRRGPVVLSPSWITSDVLALAHQMYESRDFFAMPILADALQEAGCDNNAVLDHCRDTNTTHVRGCWVVDLVLGKE